MRKTIFICLAATLIAESMCRTATALVVRDV